MARNRNTDFFSFLRSQGLRKRVARALSDLEAGGVDARGSAEKAGRRVIADLRGAADAIEKRLNIGGGTSSRRSSGAKKAATTRKRSAATRSAAAKKAATTRARKTTARKTTARKTTARKTSRKRS